MNDDDDEEEYNVTIRLLKSSIAMHVTFCSHYVIIL